MVLIRRLISWPLPILLCQVPRISLLLELGWAAGLCGLAPAQGLAATSLWAQHPGCEGGAAAEDTSGRARDLHQLSKSQPAGVGRVGRGERDTASSSPSGPAMSRAPHLFYLLLLRLQQVRSDVNVDLDTEYQSLWPRDLYQLSQLETNEGELFSAAYRRHCILLLWIRYFSQLHFLRCRLLPLPIQLITGKQMYI